MPRTDIYGGACGRTRTEPTHYSCRCGAVLAVEVHRSVNATRDPGLGARLREGGLNHIVCPACGQGAVVEVAVVYHDEEKRRLILVLPVGSRHRELEERADVLMAMGRDRGFPIPAYARDLPAVFGAAGLAEKLAELESDAVARAALKEKADAAARREVEHARKEDDLARRESDFARRAEEMTRREADAARRLEDAMRRIEDASRREEDLRKRIENAEKRLAAASLEDSSGRVPEAIITDTSTERIAPRPASEGAPERRLDGSSGPIKVVIEPGKSPRPRPRLTPPPVRDAAVERWIHSRMPTMHLVDRGHVRLLTRLAADKLEGFVAAPLEVKVQLFRLSVYPLIVLSVSKPDETVAFPLDLQRIEDRQVLGALSQGFRFILDLYDPEYLPVVQRELEAPLAANVRYILAVAEEHLGTIPVLRRSFDNALATWRAPAFDRVGRREHDLNEASFSSLPGASTTALALEVVAHWSEADSEDYLLFTRSFPLDWWRRVRSRAVTRAVELGLAVPGPLADLAVSEGMARSRKELTARTLQAFIELLGAGQHDLEADKVQKNWRALVAACEETGVPLEGKAQELIIASLGMLPPSPSRLNKLPDTPSGRTRAFTIQPQSKPGGEKPVVRPAEGARAKPADDLFPPGAVVFDPQHRSTEELIDLLDDKEVRLLVAMELGRRGEPVAVGPMFAAIRRMTRGEAVRAIPAMAAFGERAVPHLVDGLRSRQAFVRQGCALALGILKDAAGIEPLGDLLLQEPTEIWREVARAIGEVGAGAVLSLTGRLVGADADMRERIAWALAHIAARGGRAAVEALAAPEADGPIPEAARQALALAQTARSNDAEVRGEQTPKEVTVNRAFSRRFFEAMAAGPGLRRAAEDSDSGIHLTDAELLDPDEEFIEDEDILPT
jgi:CpXC protein